MTVYFFGFPAHGHTNPTLAVVAELVRRGHRVRYFSFPEFAAELRGVGAEFFDCSGFLPPEPPDPAKVGRDFAYLIGMITDTTLALEPALTPLLKADPPAVIVADSLAYWGKLLAKKNNIPFVSSTTSLAFNRYTAKLMKQTPGDSLRFLLGIPKSGRAVRRLKAAGYPVRSFVDIVQNDSETDTVVYTSAQFQPMAETFGEKYRFVGASLRAPLPARKTRERPFVYIALGTVLNDQPAFYRACAEALGGLDVDVLLATGRAEIGPLPANMKAEGYADQLAALAGASVFVTHCGMNSVTESLCAGTPMVLFPQHGEEEAVAGRVEELGAGVRLRGTTPGAIRQAVQTVLADEHCAAAARRAGDALLHSGGAQAAADAILTAVQA